MDLTPRCLHEAGCLDAIDETIPSDLDIHLTPDNYANHKTSLIRRWLQRELSFFRTDSTRTSVYASETPPGDAGDDDLNCSGLAADRNRQKELDAAGELSSALARRTSVDVLQRSVDPICGGVGQVPSALDNRAGDTLGSERRHSKWGIAR
jgi:hypothetical protein